MTHTTLKASALALLLVATAACGPTDTSQDQTKTCPDDNRVVVDGNKYCVLGQSIIEKGFVCPADLSVRHDVPGVPGAVCSDQSSLPDMDIEPLKKLVIDPPGTGSWIDEPAMACSGADPSVQACDSDSDCVSGEQCKPTGDSVCVPSSCSCDAETGIWVCTEDCGQPLECQAAAACDEAEKPVTQECTQDSECGGEQVCSITAADVCVPSICMCDATTGSWACTEDCARANKCVDPAPACEGTDPSLEHACDEDDDCDSQQVCEISMEAVCVPSGCTCDESGVWVCTEDCLAPSSCVDNADGCGDGSELLCEAEPGVCPVGQVREIIAGCFGSCVDAQTCEPPYETCEGMPDPSYQPCDVDSDCPDSFECAPSGDDSCVASSCSCEGGGWVCTEDCGQPLECQPVQ